MTRKFCFITRTRANYLSRSVNSHASSEYWGSRRGVLRNPFMWGTKFLQYVKGFKLFETSWCFHVRGTVGTRMEQRYFETSGLYYVLTECHSPKVTNQDQANLRNRHVRTLEKRKTAVHHRWNLQTRELYRWSVYITNLMHTCFILYICITLATSTCFEQYHAHLQEVQTVFYSIWYVTLHERPCRALVESRLSTSARHGRSYRVTYQML
jgi:hypothetical protein